MAQSQSGRHTQRLAQDDILSLNRQISSNPILKAIFDYAPVFVGVLTESRQFVVLNRNFVESLGIEDLESSLGLRPGELLGCIHQQDSPDGCGESYACGLCGALQTVRTSLAEDRPTVGEARITPESHGTVQAWDLRVEAKPIWIDTTRYVVLFMHDISAEKQTIMLQRVFFHDILNTAASVDSLLQLSVAEMADKPPFADMLMSGIADMIEQIRYQRTFILAESGEYTADLCSVDVAREVRSIIDIERERRRLNGVRIPIHFDGSRCLARTDRSLIRRVFVNLLKNAIEAEGSSGEIDVQVWEDDDHVILSVGNSTVMPPEVRAQVFQRSFSTKGPGRGLGTYSVKLLTTKALGGTVSFRSNPGLGTQFVVALPRSLAHIS